MKRNADGNSKEYWPEKIILMKKGEKIITLKNEEKEIVIYYNSFLGSCFGKLYTNYREKPKTLTREQIADYLKELGYNPKPYYNVRDI